MRDPPLEGNGFELSVPRGNGYRFKSSNFVYLREIACVLPEWLFAGETEGSNRPRSEGADFAKAWQTDAADAGFRDEGVRRWRQQSRKRLAV